MEKNLLSEPIHQSESTDNFKLTDKSVIKIFQDFVNKKIAENKFDNDDNWFRFNESIDINVWIEESQLRATAYPVVDGNTITTGTFLKVF